MTPNRDVDTVDVARRIAEAELSSRPRVAHGVLLAAALTMTVIVAALWLTEPDLPLRTRIALGVLTAIGAGWGGYAAWVLTRRRVLFARQRVIAGWLALLFTTVFTVGAFAIGVAGELRAGLAAGGLGLWLVAVSTLLLTRARRRLAALVDRARALEAMQAGAAR